jgi:hypothetical protein
MKQQKGTGEMIQATQLVKVKDMMTRYPVKMGANKTVQDVLRLMVLKRSNKGSVKITDSELLYLWKGHGRDFRKTFSRRFLASLKPYGFQTSPYVVLSIPFLLNTFQ